MNRSVRGLSSSKLYRKFSSMKHRCYNPKDKNYVYYGARGIRICDEWLHDFLSFYKWAIANGYKDGLTIERINTDGNYEPANCKWIPMAEQQINKRTNLIININGEEITIAEYSRRIGIEEGTLYRRYHHNQKLSDSLFERKKPVMRSDGKVFESIRQAAHESNAPEDKVAMCCRGERYKTRGYGFQFLTREAAEQALKGSEAE
jgi:hypothetical protein